MSGYTITVIRGGGARRSIPIADQTIEAVCRHALARAQDLAINGCPHGDTVPPRCVEVRDASDTLVMRIAVDPSLRPEWAEAK